MVCITLYLFLAHRRIKRARFRRKFGYFCNRFFFRTVHFNRVGNSQVPNGKELSQSIRWAESLIGTARVAWFASENHLRIRSREPN